MEYERSMYIRTREREREREMPSALTPTNNRFVLAPSQRSFKAPLKVQTFFSSVLTPFETLCLAPVCSGHIPQSPHSFLQFVTLAFPIWTLYFSSMIQLFLFSSNFLPLQFLFFPETLTSTSSLLCIPWVFTTKPL